MSSRKASTRKSVAKVEIVSDSIDEVLEEEKQTPRSPANSPKGALKESVPAFDIEDVI